jgi:hypothetical protein
MNHLGLLLSRMRGDQSEAEQLCRDALRSQRALFGDTHADTLNTMDNLAHVCTELGKLDEAAALYRELVLCGWRVTLGAEHANTLAVTDALSCVLTKMGELHCDDDTAAGSVAANATT